VLTESVSADFWVSQIVTSEFHTKGSATEKACQANVLLSCSTFSSHRPAEMMPWHDIGD